MSSPFLKLSQEIYHIDYQIILKLCLVDLSIYTVTERWWIVWIYYWPQKKKNSIIEEMLWAYLQESSTGEYFFFDWLKRLNLIWYYIALLYTCLHKFWCLLIIEVCLLNLTNWKGSEAIKIYAISVTPMDGL